MGIAEFDWKTKERIRDRAFIESMREATFEDTLEVAKQLRAKHTIITHIEEVDNIGYDELKEIESELRAEGINITFAYDTMNIDV